MSLSDSAAAQFGQMLLVGEKKLRAQRASHLPRTSSNGDSDPAFAFKFDQDVTEEQKATFSSICEEAGGNSIVFDPDAMHEVVVGDSIVGVQFMQLAMWEHAHDLLILQFGR